MSAPEKRHFRQLADVKGEGLGKKYMELYQYLAKAKVYSSEEAQSFLGLNNNAQYRKLKSYLYQFILKSLRHHRQISPRVEIYDYLNNAEILFLKGLLEPAMRELRKAEKIGVRFEFFEELATVYEWQNKVYFQLGGPYDRELALKMRDNNRRLNSLQIYKEGGYGRLIAHQRTLKEGKVAFDIQETIVVEADSIRAKMLKHYVSAYSLNLNGLLKESAEQLLALHAMVEEHPAIVLSTPNTVVPSYVNLLLLLLELGEEQRFLNALQEFKSLKFLSPTNNQSVFELSFSIELMYYMQKGMLAEGRNCIELHIDRVDLSRGFSLDYKRVEFVFQLAFFFILTEEYDAALKWVNKILNEGSMYHNVSLVAHARLFSLIIHYERKDYDFVHYQLSSVRQYLKRKQQLYGVEKALIAFVKESQRVMARGEEHKLLGKLKGQVESLFEEAPEENNFLKHFDLLTWIDFKLDGGVKSRKRAYSLTDKELL